MKEKNLAIIGIFKNVWKKIKGKKIKFIFTSLLVAVTLFFISIFDIILNPDNTIIEKHAQLLIDNNEQFVQIEKHKFENGKQDVNIQELTDNDIKQINQKLNKIGKIYLNIYQFGNLHTPSNMVMTYKSIYDILQINPDTSRNPYTYFCDDLDIVEWNDFSTFFEKDIIGKFPEKNDEIMISNYLADLLIKEGLKPYSEDNYYKANSYEELVKSNKYFNFGEFDKVKIVGIINYDLSEFESLKNISWGDYNSHLEKYSAVSQELSYKNKNIYNKIFVNKDFIGNLKVNDGSTKNVWQNKITKTGLLVMENNERGFEKLLNQFKYNESIMAKSTYTEEVDIMIQFTNIFVNFPLIAIVLISIVVIFIILSIISISELVLFKENTIKQQIKKLFLYNFIPIFIISIILTCIILMIVPKLFMNILTNGSIITSLFTLGKRQFIVIIISIFVLGLFSYLVTLCKVKYK